jgi:hypothetical protein
MTTSVGRSVRRVAAVLSPVVLLAGLGTVTGSAVAASPTSPAASARQERIYFNRGFLPDTWWMRPDGSGATKVASAYVGGPVSPDGTTVLIRNDAGISRMAPDGSQMRFLGAGVNPAWSPDGRRIAYVDAVSTSIMVMNADGSGKRLVVGDGIALAWSSDGTQLFFLRSGGGGLADIWRVGVDGTGPRMIVALGSDDSHFLGAAPGNRAVFQRCTGTCLTDAPPSDLWRVDRDGSHLTRLTNDSAYESGAAYSPDGTRIAFSRSPSRLDYGGYQIYTMAANGTDVHQITSGADYNQIPHWGSVRTSSTTRLFADYFTDGNDAGWTQYNRYWHVLKGRYVLDGGYRPGACGRGGWSVTHAGDTSWTDYAVTVAFDTSQGPWPDADVLFRVGSLSSAACLPVGYRLHVWTDYPYGGGPYIGINRYDSEGGTVVKRMQGSARTNLSPVAGSNTVRIEVRSAKITVFMNGKCVLKYVDPKPILSGGIGLLGSREATPSFDNVVVRALPATG